MKKLNILPVLALMALSPVFTGCGDDDIIKTPLDDPMLSESGATVSALDFSWDKVPGATQYGYELSDPDGEIVAADVTTATSARFTGLKEATAYTLTVRAFANVNSAMTTSKVITLTATTSARVPLATPSGIVAAAGNGGIVVSWNPVDHATSYHYTYIADGAEGDPVSASTKKTSVTLSGLPVGDYIFTLYADSNEEEYKESDVASITFTRSREETDRISGRYASCITNSSWSADLVIYDDGSYVIEKWYGVDGYDLEFTVNSDATVNIVNYGMASAGWYYVPSGVGSVGNVEIYPSDGYSYFSMSEATMWMYAANGNIEGYDKFTWSAGPTVNDLAGSYTETSTGLTYNDNTAGWDDLSYTRTAKISVVDNKTVKLENFYSKDTSITGTVDLAAGTIYFKSQMMDQYYIFALQSESDDSKGVTATINEDGSITIDKWSMFYYGYSYLWDMHTVLTKK